jgi:hypothetical protein
VIRERLRLAIRLHRFELFAFGVVMLGLTVAAVLVSGEIARLRPAPACLAFDGSTPAAGCDRALEDYYRVLGYGGMILTALLFVSLAVGIFLGVPIVARELERGTARLAWSLGPSRWRWFLANALPILAVVVILAFLAGIGIDRYFAATTPNEDMANSFTGFGLRGGLVASRAAFIFAIAVAVGAVIGRSLPAVIIAGLIVTIGLVGGERVNQKILASEAVPLPFEQTTSADLYVEQRFQLPDGSLVGWEYFGDSGGYDANGEPLYPMINLVVPGTRYHMAELREALALAGGTLVALLIAGLVVARRRPG